MFCLLTTFVIYVRYASLRTLPGLMLMNLVVAMFFAQLLYLINSSGAFSHNFMICLLTAVAQHYFWLVSFAWMVSMSLDIYRCLSDITYSADNVKRYWRYLLFSWLGPMTIPLLSSIFSMSPSTHLGYDSDILCWLANPHSVLYLFAIPVLAAVGLNLILFIGSAWRIYQLMQNAANVGRKEDNRQRLVLCIKISSWMGLS